MAGINDSDQDGGETTTRSYLAASVIGSAERVTLSRRRAGSNLKRLVLVSRAGPARIGPGGLDLSRRPSYEIVGSPHGRSILTSSTRAPVATSISMTKPTPRA